MFQIRTMFFFAKQHVSLGNPMHALKSHPSTEMKAPNLMTWEKKNDSSAQNRMGVSVLGMISIR